MKKTLIITLFASTLLLGQTKTDPAKIISTDTKPLANLTYEKGSIEEGIVLALKKSPELSYIYELTADLHWANCNNTWKDINEKMKDYGASVEWGILLGLKIDSSPETVKQSDSLYKTLILSKRALHCFDPIALNRLNYHLNKAKK